MLVKYLYAPLISLCCACILLSQCKSDTTISTPKLKIAYNAITDPSQINYEVIVSDLEGKNATNISKNASMDWIYSAYKDRLFVISDRDTCSQCYFLYETDPQGAKWRKISQTLVQDSWVSHRNEGTELIIKPVGAPNTAFQIIDLAGNVISVVDPKMKYFNDPSFSPNGEQIVFRGYDQNLGDVHKAELYIYDLKTSRKQKITAYPTTASTFDHYQYYASPPRWNAHLGTITYSSGRDGLSKIMSLDTTNMTHQNLTRKNVKAVWHDISLDGKFLAFDGQLNYKADSTTTQIFISEFEKRSTKKVTKGPGYKYGPVFILD